jgi:SAM-dependent methyltransferase
MSSSVSLDSPFCGACRAAISRRVPSAVEEFDLALCDVCGSARTWPPVPAAEIGSWYRQDYYGKGNVRFNALFESLTRWFRQRRANRVRHWTKKGLVLDVGCGRGLTLSYLRDAGYQTIGFEVSDIAAHHARDLRGLDVRTGDFLNSDLPDDTFEAVIFWHSLEHLSDPLAALDRATRLLKPGGLLVIAVPNFDSLQAAVSGRFWFHLDVPRHYVHFTARALRRAVEGRGFRIVEMAHLSLEQNPYGWIQSLLNLVFPRDLLYSLLKRDHARPGPLRRYPLRTVASAIGGLLLLPVAFALTAVETILRRGGSVEIYAVKEAN